MANQQIAADPPKGEDPHPDYQPNKGQRDPDKGNPEFQKFWENLLQSGKPFFPGVPFDQLKAVALAAWKAGKTKQEIRKLFGEKSAALFQSNAAGGEGQPSPYLQYFLDNPDQAGALIDYLNSGKGVVGPQQQQEFFNTFEGLQDSYYTSLGLTWDKENNRVYDAEYPHLTPYLAEQKRRSEQGLSSVFDKGGADWVQQGTLGSGAYWNNTGDVIPEGDMPRHFHGMFATAFQAGDSQQMQNVVSAAQSYAQMQEYLAPLQQNYNVFTPRSADPFQIEEQ